MSALSELWCNATHGGGIVQRDPSGRINWQCWKCGRWSTPVPPSDEHAHTDEAIRQREQS